LPNSFVPDKIADTVQQMRVSITNSVVVPLQKNQKQRTGLEFEWIPDPYELAEESKKELDKQNKAKNISKAPFVPAVNLKKEKFMGINGQLDSLIKHSEDPYEAMKEKEVREAWLERLKILYGEFKPFLQDKNLERVGRSLLPDIVIQIRKCVANDWPDTRFLVGCTYFG
jgi:hypothetical protein